MEPKDSRQRTLALPLRLASRRDIGYCERELELLDDFFQQAGIRAQENASLPNVSPRLSILADENGLNLIHAEDRAALKKFMFQIKAKAPVVHITLPAEASIEFKDRLLSWFRSNAHPHTLLKVGLQPELAAGCILRTTNKVFDFSLRKSLDKNKNKLAAALEAQV